MKTTKIKTSQNKENMLTVRMPSKQFHLLTRLAHSTNTTRSDLVRHIVELFLKK